MIRLLTTAEMLPATAKIFQPNSFQIFSFFNKFLRQLVRNNSKIWHYVITYNNVNISAAVTLFM